MPSPSTLPHMKDRTEWLTVSVTRDGDHYDLVVAGSGSVRGARPFEERKTVYRISAAYDADEHDVHSMLFLLRNGLENLLGGYVGVCPDEPLR